MQDYGEYVDPYQVFYNNQTGEQVHNAYVNYYHEASYKFFQSFNQESYANGLAPEYIYYVRSGYTGTQGNVWSSCKFYNIFKTKIFFFFWIRDRRPMRRLHKILWSTSSNFSNVKCWNSRNELHWLRYWWIYLDKPTQP